MSNCPMIRQQIATTQKTQQKSPLDYNEIRQISACRIIFGHSGAFHVLEQSSGTSFFLLQA